MKPDRPPVVVTQCHLRFGFNVAKSLARAGRPVVAAAPQRPMMCQGQENVVACEVHPGPFKTPEGFVDRLAELAETHRAAAILPVHEDIFVASLLRHRIGGNVRLLAPDFEILMSVHDKFNLYLQSEKQEVPCPPTSLVHSFADVAEVVERTGGPVILKPRYGEGAAGVLRIGADDLTARSESDIDRIVGAEGYIAQPYFSGVGVGVGMLIRGGRVVATSQHLRLREAPITGGASTARLTFRSASLERNTEALLTAMGFEGVAMVEYRMDPQAGEARLLDVNPRYWGGLAAHIESGVDYPVLHVEGILGDVPPGDPVVSTRQIESRWALGEMRSVPSLMMRGRWREVGEAVRPRHGARVVYEDLVEGGLRGLAVQAIAYRNRARSGEREAKRAFFREAVARDMAASPAALSRGTGG